MNISKIHLIRPRPKLAKNHKISFHCNPRPTPIAETNANGNSLGQLKKNIINRPPKLFKPIAFSLCTSAQPSALDFSDIDYKELREKLESREILLIDVRSPEERETEGYVPRSVNLPLATLASFILLSPEEFLEEVGVSKPNVDAPLATMCLAGLRAQTAQLALIGAGYKNVRRYAGSFEDWVENKGELEYIS